MKLSRLQKLAQILEAFNTRFLESLKRQTRLGIVGPVILFALMFLGVHSLVVSINWSAAWSWAWPRALGLVLLALAIWISMKKDRREAAGKVIKHPWFGRMISIAVGAFVLYFFVGPWLGQRWDTYQLAQVAEWRARETTQVKLNKSHEDIERTAVATEANPVVVTRRSELDRTTVIPLGYVSFKVTYPSPNDSTVLITLIHKKDDGNLEIRPYAKWTAYRPLDTDSVTFFVHQHELK